MSGSIPEGARVGSMVTLEAIQARFCDGTDLRAKKKKKKKKRHQGIGVSAQQGPKNVEVGAPLERYFIVEGELDSGFLNFRAFLFNDMLLLATPQDVEGPYFSAKSVPLWYFGLSTVRDAEVTAMDDGAAFMINGSDGRTIFRGAPKSWPPLDVWIKLLRRCLNGTPPAPEDVIAEVQKLVSNADPPFREQDGGIRDDGHERYDEEGSGQQQEQVDDVGGLLLETNVEEHFLQTARTQGPLSGRSSRRHSAITVEELELVDVQNVGRSSRKGSLELPSQVPSLLSEIMERKARSKTTFRTTPRPGSRERDQAKANSAPSNTSNFFSSATAGTRTPLVFDAIGGKGMHLLGAQRSLERMCSVLRQCSRRMTVQAPAILQTLIDDAFGSGLSFFKHVLAVSRMQSFVLADPGFRRALVHDCIAGDEQISRMHFIDTAQPLAGNWLLDTDRVDKVTRRNMSLVAQYWSARALLRLCAVFQSKPKQVERSSSRPQPEVLTQRELCRLLLGGDVQLARGEQRDSSRSESANGGAIGDSWPRAIPTEYHKLRPVVVRCLLERVVGYDDSPGSSSIDMGLDEGTLALQNINIGGFVRGDQAFGFDQPHMIMKHVSALSILFQCLAEAPAVDAISVDTMIEIKDLFCGADTDLGPSRRATRYRDGSANENVRDAIARNLSLLVAESKGNWPLWFVSVMVQSARSMAASMPIDNQIFTSSSRYLSSLAEGSNAAGVLHELSCDTLASIMAQVLLDQIGSGGKYIPAHAQLSFGHALGLACDAIAFSFSREENGQLVMHQFGKRCMRRFLTRLVLLVSQNVNAELNKGSSGGQQSLSPERRVVWRTIPDLSRMHWAGFYEMIVFVERFVLTSYWDTDAALASGKDIVKSGIDISSLYYGSGGVPSGYFRTQVCKAPAHLRSASEHGLGDNTVGLHLDFGAKPKVCLDLPLVSNMIGVLKSLQHAHRRFEEDSSKMRHLPEYAALNQLGQSLSMFESVQDLMKSIERQVNDSLPATVVKYMSDTRKDRVLDDQIFATAVCCELRLRNICLQENAAGRGGQSAPSASTRGTGRSGLGLLAAPTALQIARGLATSIQHTTHKDKHVGPVSTLPVRSDFESHSSLPKGGQTPQKNMYGRRLTSILNMDAVALRKALTIKTISQPAPATLSPGTLRISENDNFSSSGDLPGSLSKRERLEAELLHLKLRLSKGMEMKHKIAALNEEARMVRQRTAQLRRDAKQEDDDYRAQAANIAKDVYVLQSQNERVVETKSTNMPLSTTSMPPVSSATLQMEDRLLEELCSQPRARDHRPTSPLSSIANTSGTLGSTTPSAAIAVHGRRASLEAYHTDWQKRWDEREKDYARRMKSAQRVHREKMQTVLMEQGNGQKMGQNSSLSSDKNETVVLLRNQVNAESDALEQIRKETAEGSGEAVVQSARKHAEDVQQLVEARQEWERHSMQRHKSVLTELELEREQVQSDALDELSSLGEHFQTKAKSILGVQARIDRNAAFSWSPSWLTTKMQAHYAARETKLFKDSQIIHDNTMRITLASWEDRFQKLTTFLSRKYDAYQEHLELNEADVDVLDQADLLRTGSTSIKSNTGTSDKGEDLSDEDVHEYQEDDVDRANAIEAKDNERVKLVKNGLSQKYWQLLRQEKRQWRRASSLGSDERLVHMANVQNLSLQQSQRQLEDTILEGKLVHARWTKVLRENGQRQLQAVKLLTEKWQEIPHGGDSMEEWHATQDNLLGRSSMGLTTLARTMMDVQLSHQRTAEAWKAAAKNWQRDVQEQTEKAIVVVTDAIEDAHIQATSYMLHEVEEARKNLQLIRNQIMHRRIDSFKKKMEHKARVASIEQAEAREQVRERARRVELETLKAHVLTMWNRMGVSLQDRAHWLLHVEGEIKGDHDSRSSDDPTGQSSVTHHKKLMKLYESTIEEAKKRHSQNVHGNTGKSAQKERLSSKWRRRSLYGVDTVALRLPLPNDQRRQAAHARLGEVGMSPSVEPIL